MLTHQSHQKNTESIPASAESKLLLAALRLFSEKGYDGTSIREIIEEAGVSRPVLYYHFKNKENLFSTLVKTQFEEACSDIEAIIEGESVCRSRLKALVLKSFEGAKRSPETVRLLLQFFFSPDIDGIELDKETLGQRRFDLIQRIMSEAIESEQLARRDPEMLTLAFMGMVDVRVMAFCANPDMPLDESLAEQLIEIFMNGARAR